MYVQSRNQKIFSRNIFPNTPENPNAKQKKILVLMHGIHLTVMLWNNCLESIQS